MVAIEDDIDKLYKRIDNGFKSLEERHKQELRNVRDSLNTFSIYAKKRFEKLSGEIEKLKGDLRNHQEEVSEKFEDIKKEKKQKSINECIAAIKDNQINTAVEKFKEVNDVNAITQIVNQAYNASLSNFEKVLSFGRNLPYISQLGIAYDCLFNEMRSNSHLDNPEIFRLAYKVKEAMEMSNYPKIDQEHKNKFDTLKGKFQDGIRRVLWDNYIVLKSKQNGGLLDSGPDHMRHHPEEESTNGYLRWLPIPKEEGRYFVLKSKQNGGLLDSGPNHMRHHPEEESTNGYLRWQFKPKSDGSYVLKSLQNGGLLDSGPDHMRHHPEEESTNGYLRWYIK